MQPSVLILGDSLAFSRGHKGQELVHSWPYLVQQRIQPALVWNRAQGGATVYDVALECEKLLFYYNNTQPQFDVIVLQIGIVDACPRPLPHWMHRTLGRVPAVGGTSIGTLEKISRVFKLHYRPWVSSRMFIELTRRCLDASASLAKLIVVVAIAPPAHYLLSNAPKCELFVEQYNDLLAAAVGDFSISSCTRFRFVNPWRRDCHDLIFNDGVHLTNAGHRIVADAVVREIRLPC